MKHPYGKRLLRTIFIRLGLASLMLMGLLAVTPMGTVHAATITVMSNADSGAGTLRQAITDAVAGDTITFANSLSGMTITLASTLTLSKDVTIDGSALAAQVTISGGNAVRVFYVNSGVTVTLNGVTVSNGSVTGTGGGIDNAGTVNAVNSTFYNNRASTNGGAIYNTGTLNVTASTFLTNTATSGSGGAIYNSGSMVLNNDTLNQGRAASGSGGAIYNSGTATLNNDTLYGGRAATASGGGIYNGGTITVNNTIVTGSLAGGNCAGTLSGTNNLANDATCGASFTNSASIQLGTFGNYGGSTRTIPLLTGSSAIGAGSGCEASDQRGVSRPQGAGCDIGAYEQQLPTVVTGSASALGYDTATIGGTVNANYGSTSVFFQYGETVSYGTSVSASPSTATGNSDTGVSLILNGLSPGTTYHYRVAGQNSAGTVYGNDATFTTVYCQSAITVTNANDSGAGSLRQAIADICPSGTITFDNDYNITTDSELAISKNMTIDGTGHTVTVDGGNSHRVFYVYNVTATINNLTISNGKIIGGGGGGVYVYYGTLNLNNDTFSDNASTDPTYSGGAIYNYYGTLHISDSTFSGNTATNNGGSGAIGAAGSIYNNSGTVTIASSTFSGNTASNVSGGASSGGIYNMGTLTVSNSTFANNMATASNGGSVGAGIVNAMSGTNATITNTILSNNQLGSNCAGSFTDGGYNLEWGAGTSSTTCGFGTASVDPLLSALGDYGGSTLTFALLPGSQAIDSGSGCAPSDQRGVTRPQGTACDVGAFESQGFDLALYGGDSQSTPINTAFPDALVVSVTAVDSNEPIDGGVIIFTPPASGASAVLATSPATISGGLASVTATANNAIGSYLVDANTIGASEGVAFSLTNLDLSTLSIDDVTATEGNTGTTTFTFTVSLSAPAPSIGVTFDIAIADGTALAPSDYVANSLTGQTIPAGDSSYTFDVTVNGDALAESDETFFVNISNVVGAAINDGQGLGTITNDDLSPTVTTDPASAITGIGATLNGTVNANGADSTVSFEYGPDTSYGSIVTAKESPVTGTTDMAVTFNLTGLTANTLYHYRVVAQNAIGTSYGNDMTFTTLGVSLITEIHNAVHATVTTGTLGESLHASATITGSGPTPTGTVTFTVFDNPACSGTGTNAGTISLTAGIADPSTSQNLNVDGLSFRAHYNGDSNYPTTDSNCTSISTSPYPTVLTLSANALPQDGAILTVSPANLIVQFSRDVLHGNASDADSAENPVNYLFIAPGANGFFDTVSCGPTGLQADDIKIMVNTVTYDPATFIAKLTVNNGNKLANGVYRLLICGTTSIIDSSRIVYLNNHLADSVVTFTIATPSTNGNKTSKDKLPSTGFAPNIITRLPVQPLNKSYGDMSLWLEIPALGLKQSIVGVPGSDWDVTWLNNQIGYLQGTAFPTWNGNSVLTGHVYDANGKPGPFVNLGKLTWGQKIIVHLDGQKYIYEVRSVSNSVSPNGTSSVTKHEELPWLTLITCRGYDEKTDSYLYRTVVRAVLVDVK